MNNITNCPNCGGILERGGHCPYCGADINIVHDIIVSDRTMLGEDVELNLVMRHGKTVNILPLKGRISNITIRTEDFAMPDINVEFEGTIRKD